MPIAAVPKYLGQDFSDASPGLRFGMFLQLWGRDNRTEVVDWTNKDTNYRVAGRDREERAFSDDNKRGALDESAALTGADRARLRALIDRQRVLAAQAGESLTIEATAIAPFTTGLGNEHPLENGFAFLNPYGLPYLPGSGVKGVLRQAARELAGTSKAASWDVESEWPLGSLADDQNSYIDALFGKEDSNNARRGALQFWDVIPSTDGSHLTVEVMTAHQSHYYQNGESPHESGRPNPINFLTVPLGSGFTFHVVCDRSFLARIAPELAEGDRWKTLLREAFNHAFDWLGFGAKTAVGYGAMAVDGKAEEARLKREEAQRKASEARRRLDILTAGLPADAASLVEAAEDERWMNNDYFLEATERLLDQPDGLTGEAQRHLREELNGRWPGIMENPEATQGKKKKPKYKERPKAIALRLLESGRADNP